jgi:hypothetical protein
VALPFERLRALARYSGDDTELVLEAADCLGDFGSDPQLLTVCRRLLAHHPASGPLWWLCAHVVAAANPTQAANDAARRLRADRSAARLASTLPFPHDEPIAVLGWPEVAGAALSERPDLDVVAIRGHGGDDGLRYRLPRIEVRPRVVDETTAMALAPSHLLVEVLATSPTTALVPTGTADLLWSLGAARLWLVAGTGRLLPERLFEVARHEVERADDPVAETLEVGRAERVAGPAGLDPPERLATRVDCPVAPELLRL